MLTEYWFCDNKPNSETYYIEYYIGYYLKSKE